MKKNDYYLLSLFVLAVAGLVYYVYATNNMQKRDAAAEFQRLFDCSPPNTNDEREGIRPQIAQQLIEARKSTIDKYQELCAIRDERIRPSLATAEEFIRYAELNDEYEKTREDYNTRIHLAYQTGFQKETSALAGLR